jgi:hypothetical protein
VKRLKAWLIIFPLGIFFPLLGMTTDKIGEPERSFKAELSGKEEVPPVKTNAEGMVTFKLNKEGDELIYVVTLKNIENVIAAHIHQGEKGKNGPPVAPLLIEPKKPAVSGTLYSEGRIRAYELIGPLKGNALQSLIKMIEAGDAYVNVHTVKHPDGEIRGQIKSINDNR